MNDHGNPPDIHDARSIGPLTEAMLDRLESAIVGKRDMLRLVLAAVFADGHVLLEDVPGVAKTATARAIAQCCGLEFSRVQFTPDLIPADITGATVFDPALSSTEFRPGPVFANLVLGDEINRAPPKTQSALLEAMEERQVTVDGATRLLPDTFVVIGTQNPIESEGTYPLPEAQLDRFLIRTGVGYPSHEAEVDLVMRRAARRTDRIVIEPMLTPGLDPVGAIGDRDGAHQRPRCAVHRGHRRRDSTEPTHRGGRQPPRLAGAAEDVACVGGHGRPQLRAPR